MSEKKTDVTWWSGVAEVHGQAMCQAVLDAGLGSEAVGRMVRRAQGLRDGELAKAAAVLAEVFNRTSSAYCRSQGWTEEMLALCDRDLNLAFAGKVWVPGEGKRVVLDS